MTQVHNAEGTNEFELVRLMAKQSSQCCSSYVTTNIMLLIYNLRICVVQHYSCKHKGNYHLAMINRAT